MHPFEQTISVVGPVVLAIVFLTLFFKIAARVERKSTGEGNPYKFRGMVDKNTRVKVHLNNQKSFDDVLLIGFINPGTGKIAMPYEWQNLVILEEPNGRRFLIPAKQLRMIEVPPTT